ncbi:MAG: WD40/YVTN/BNR-like repeat-containing protein [Candidatus Dormibacteria bacterium]
MAETVLLIGTRKGALLARRSGPGTTWELGPLQLAMSEVYGTAIDLRGKTPRLFAAATSPHWGPSIFHSDDLGTTWTEPEQAPVSFPKATGAAVVRVWQIQPGPTTAPGTVWAGVEPHALFRSDDGGLSFSLVEGLYQHPHQPRWEPGGGGACLHTILPHPDDPDRVLVAMSAGGVYRSRDGGHSREPANSGIQAYWLPEDQRFPEFGQCVHKVASHPARPERLFAQNHFGVYRSDDYGTSWHAIERGLPANFGFPLLVHPNQPDTLFVFPLQGDSHRFPAADRCRLYRSRDAGESWEPLERGLPKDEYRAAVLRDALCSDGADPAGVYFGTRAGEVYASPDGGESFHLVAQHLPDVLSVRAAQLA